MSDDDERNNVMRNKLNEYDVDFNVDNDADANNDVCVFPISGRPDPVDLEAGSVGGDDNIQQRCRVSTSAALPTPSDFRKATLKEFFDLSGFPYEQLKDDFSSIRYSSAMIVVMPQSVKL